MRDSVALVIGSRQINSFISYEADSNVLVPADVFSCRIAGIDPEIKAGDRFELIVNGQLEMTGLIDRVSPSYSKGTQEMTIEGRDLMGLILDSYIEEWKTLNKMSLKALAARLLKKVPFLDKSKIYFDHEKKDSGTARKKKRAKKISTVDSFSGASANVCQCEAGRTIFEILADYAQRNGLLMWMEPDGSLIFGRLKKVGDPAEFAFYTYKSGTERGKNNIIEASLEDDISKRYSKLTVVAQIQGLDNFSVGDTEIQRPAINEKPPFDRIYKPLVLQAQCTSVKAADSQAKLELLKREAEGWRARLTVAGHSQNGNNYHANRVCIIKDEVLGLEGDYLILGRKFTMTRNDGPRTEMAIGKLMEGYTVQ